MIKKIQDFIESVQIEMNKVSWPTWDELKGSTYVVLSLAMLLALFLFLVDQVLNRVISILL